MNKQEAITAMEKGQKVTNQYFSREEWITLNNGMILMEDGCQCTPKQFWISRTDSSWDEGYSIWKPEYSSELELVPSTSFVLAQEANEVPHGTDVAVLVKNMFKLIEENIPRGVGLAAPQVGLLERIIVVNYGATRTAIINPIIAKAPGKKVTSFGEGCLSFPGESVDMQRHKRVVVTGFDENWEPVKIDARGFLAFVMQHEIDHLNGVTIA